MGFIRRILQLTTLRLGNIQNLSMSAIYGNECLHVPMKNNTITSQRRQSKHRFKSFEPKEVFVSENIRYPPILSIDPVSEARSTLFD